jgi:uncharacterized protein (TIGR00106 family)
MLSVLLEFSMFPTSDECRDGSSVSKQVSKIIDMIDKSGVNYKLTPMGTVIETESMREALDIVEKAYNELSDCDRVYSALKFDIRKNSQNRFKSKIDSVERNLNKEVSK